MAIHYVRSGATGSNDGTSWANAYTTLAAAISGGAAGDTYYVSEDHNESTAAALTLGFKGTVASPDHIICVNHSGSVPPVAADLRTTAQVATTGSNALTVTGFYRCYGVKFTCGSSTSTAILTIGFDGQTQVLENCVLALGGTGTTTINIGAGRGLVRCINTTVSFGAVGQKIALGAYVELIGPSTTPFVASATVPTLLFDFANRGPTLIASGVDLSASGSGNTLFNNQNGTQWLPSQLINCKLDPSVTVGSFNATIGAFEQPLQLIGCNSGTQIERNEFWQPLGNLTTELTVIRSGGAADPNGTGYSWKIVPANPGNIKNSVDFPFVTFEGVIWNSATGVSKTLTVHVVNDGLTLTNADIWLEVDYLGSSATPLSTRVSSGLASMLDTAVNNTTDSGASWTTTGLTSPVKQLLSLSFTPQLVGPVRWRVRYSRQSGNVYICPKAELV